MSLRPRTAQLCPCIVSETTGCSRKTFGSSLGSQFDGDRSADGRGVPGLSTPPAVAAQPKDHCQRRTVNREIEWLQCMFQFAVTRKYIAESPAAGVRHFDERRERPAKRMLTVEEEQSIFETAPV